MSGDPTDFQTEVDKFNEVMAMDREAVVQLAQKVRAVGDPTLTDEELAAWKDRLDRYLTDECGPDEFCGPDGSDACPNHDSYFAVAAMPRLIAALRASRAEVERLRPLAEMGQAVVDHAQPADEFIAAAERFSAVVSERDEARAEVERLRGEASAIASSYHDLNEVAHGLKVEVERLREDARENYARAERAEQALVAARAALPHLP